MTENRTDQDGLAGEQLCWEGPGGCGGQQAEYEPAVCPESKGGQRRPGLAWFSSFKEDSLDTIYKTVSSF